jgi:two-component system sensor histidine kinase PhoQ
METAVVADTPSGAVTASVPQSKPFSLRWRMSLIAGIVLVLALGLVGFALASANHRSSVSALKARMESYVYLVLAAAELGDAGVLHFSDNLGDPRLSQPGSGIYIHVHGATDHWNSPSSLGMKLPELSTVPAAESRFSEPLAELDFYSYQYGVSWQLPDGGVIPFTVSVLADPGEIERQTSAFRFGLWRALGTAGAILLLAQFMLIYLGFRPLQRVAGDVVRVESGLAPRLEGHYPREIEPLARNVNKLLETEKANQQRYRNALDSLAHSLKTPLAILRAGLETDSPSGRNSMRKAVDEMNQLVATRLQRAALSARRTMSLPIAVEPQVQRILASLQKVYAHKMISTDVLIPVELKFFGEQRDLLELLGNVLDNAFKYGRAKVRVTAAAVDSAGTRDGLWIRVEDDGPGIDPAQWPVLLKRGVRGDEREEGYGLGLAIVLELITAYGGKIEISRGDWGGTLIYLEIPGS